METTLSSRTVFKGRLLTVESLDVELPGGGRAVREVVRHPGAAVVLARDANGLFVLVKQYRKAIERELIEAVAGTLQPGEDPAACAAREVEEETGFTAAELRPLGTLFPAPGYTDERLHVFFARLGPRGGRHQPDADERIEIVRLTEAELAEQIAAGAIEDAKTLAAWLLYRERGTRA